MKFYKTRSNFNNTVYLIKTCLTVFIKAETQRQNPLKNIKTLSHQTEQKPELKHFSLTEAFSCKVEIIWHMNKYFKKSNTF